MTNKRIILMRQGTKEEEQSTETLEEDEFVTSLGNTGFST
jgi:hypothetical protein